MTSGPTWQNGSPAVAVVVVNWNQKHLTQACVQSLSESTVPLKIIVVDNGSEDDSADCIANHFPRVDVIALPENTGFGPACNHAIGRILNQTCCDYIFVLNNDAEIEPDTVEKLLETAGDIPQAGLWSPKILFRQKAPDTLWYAGARRRRWATEVPSCSGRGQRDRGQFDRVQEIDFVFGAAMFIHRRVFETIGLFDERFFLYMEDLDFCLRARSAGFSPCFVPQARVHHLGSASTRENKKLKSYHVARSLVLYFFKSTPISRMIPVLLVWLYEGTRYLLPDLMRGNLIHMAYCLKGILDGLVAHCGMGRGKKMSSLRICEEKAGI